ncbi:MAG: NAD-dependent dihydropyrimidine dehydrogenase subunit PreA [Candidatus Thermoplasmatota archaeon]
MAELIVEFAGIEFQNPFLLASAPPTMDGEHIIMAAKKGWGGAVTKTIGFEKIVELRPRLESLSLKKRTVAIENIELISSKTLETWCKKYIPKIKKETKEFILIGSIMGGKEEEWIKAAKELENAGVDMLELNFSCPHGMPEKGMGMLIGQSEKLTYEITKVVKSSVSIPVIVKLTPNVTDIGSVALSAERGGANALSAINTVSSIIGIDIENEVPLPNVEGYSTQGGLSGTAIRPIALRCIAEIKKTSKLQISGIGGIDDWRAGIEFILIGAETLQLCTAVMLNGFEIIDNLKENLLSYMERKGYSNIKEFSGNAFKKLKKHSELICNKKIHAKVIIEKCNGCGKCAISCKYSGANAISVLKKKARINVKKCSGCGLCKIVCPFDGIAI